MSTVPLIAVAAVMLFPAFVLPVRCQGPIAKPPFRGCRKSVYGFVGHCRYHGRRPGLRIMAVLGGRHLPARRICDKCGRSTTFCRAMDSGKPFLGCAGFPECKRPRWLHNYTF
jgi:hypothetical protein